MDIIVQVNNQSNGRDKLARFVYFFISVSSMYSGTFFNIFMFFNKDITVYY